MPCPVLSIISCITVLYESYRRGMQLIWQIQYSYVENLFKESYKNNSTCVTL